MKIIKQETVECSEGAVEIGQFNGGEHTFLELEPGAYQTISVKLPNGKFVTFAFVPGHRDPADFECCDIHATLGPRVPRKDGGRPGYLHHFIGFTVGHDTFTTRRLAEPTTLATLLLRSEHYSNPETLTQAGALVAKK